MKLAFTSVTFRDRSIEEIIDIARQNSIGYIEWGADKHLPYGDVDAIDQINTLQHRYGIKALSYGSYYVLGEKDLSKFASICKTADAIGAKTVRIWIGNKPGWLYSKQKIAILSQELQELCELAERYHLDVAGEFHKNTYNDDYRRCLNMIALCAKNNLKTYWQPLGHAQKDLSNLAHLLPHLAVIHTFHWKNFNTRYPFEQNNQTWRQYMQLALAHNKEIPFVMEFVKDDSLAQFQADAAIIRKWGAEIEHGLS